MIQKSRGKIQALSRQGSCFILLVALTVFAAPRAEARREVESSERLRFLKDSTGKDTESSSFQARVDAIMHPDSDAETNLVGREDQAARDKATAAAMEISTPLPELTPSLKGTPLTGEKEQARIGQEKPTEQNLKVGEMVKNRLDNGEKNYQAKLENLLQEQPPEAEKQKAETPKEAAPSNGNPAAPEVRPSLANNPFYFSPENEKKFSEDKPLIVSRMVQRGYSPRIAENIVNSATSPDELIMILMQQEDYTYGDAVDLVRSS